jgi:hypothetical protein
MVYSYIDASFITDVQDKESLVCYCKEDFMFGTSIEVSYLRRRR